MHAKACLHSFINSGYFYSASSSPLLLRGAPDYTALKLYHSFIHSIWIFLQRLFKSTTTQRRSRLYSIETVSFIHSFIHSFNLDISTAPLQVHYYSEALPTIQH